METPNQHGKDAQNARLEIRAEEVSRWLIVSILHDRRLLEERNRFKRKILPASTAKLERLGCDRMILLNTLAYGQRLPGLHPQFVARKLRKLASDCEKLLVEMLSLSPPGCITWVTGIASSGPSELVIKTSSDPAACSWFCDPRLAHELSSKAALYREVATMCQARRLPTLWNVFRFGYIWSVAYVNACTGDPHCELVAPLLNLIGDGKTEQKLMATFNDLRIEQPWILECMQRATEFLESVGSSVKPPPSEGFEVTGPGVTMPYYPFPDSEE